VSDNHIRDLLAIRLRATAALQLQMAAALMGKGQDELRQHFMDSASLMAEAIRELRQQAQPPADAAFQGSVIG